MRKKCLTYKLKTLFKVKDKSLHLAYKIHKGVCTWGGNYLGESIQNVELCWDEHNNPVNKSNPLKYIKDNLDHVFNWSVLANAPKNMFKGKVLEAFYIVLEKRTLNEQLGLDRLNLFQNGVTSL